MLPGIDRGHRLDAWGQARPLAAEMSPRLFGLGLELWDDTGGRLGPIEDLDLYVNDDPTQTLADVEGAAGGELRIVGVLNDRENQTQRCVWDATLDTDGRMRATVDAEVRRGYSRTLDLSPVLEDWPPTVYFLDGTTAIGSVRYDNRHGRAEFDLNRLPHPRLGRRRPYRRHASNRGERRSRPAFDPRGSRALTSARWRWPRMARSPRRAGRHDAGVVGAVRGEPRA